MKILFDTNILLDVLLDRQPHVEHAALLLSKVERSEILGYLCATTITTLHYLLHKTLGGEPARRHLHTIMALFTIAPVNRIILENALSKKFKDFEDAVIHESAVHMGADSIVTRNLKDFKHATLPVYEPLELLCLTKILPSSTQR